MTLEQALAALELAKTEAAEAKALADAKDSEIASLKSKNAEIITEKRKLQQAKKDDASDDETASDLRKRIEAEYKPKIDELSAKFEALEKERNTLAVDTALISALDKVGVAVQLRSAALAYLKSARKIEVANGGVVCDGKGVGESVADWAATDEGKAFISAPSNGGSAAPGGGSAPTTLNKSAMKQADKGAYIAKHGLAAYEKLPL